MCKRNRVFFLGVILFVGIISTNWTFLVSEADAQQGTIWNKPISIASGPVGGLHYALMTGVAGLLTRQTGITVTAEATNQSAINVDLLRKKEAELASCTADAVYDAWGGREGYFEGRPQRLLRLIHSGYTSCGTTVTLANSDIKTHADLRGKRFYAWQTTSPVIQRWVKIILEGNNLTRNDLRLMEAISTKESVTALLDGRCDATLIAGGPPAAAVVELTNTKPCRIISIGDPEIKVMKEKYPFVFPFPLAANTYKGQDKALLILGVNVHIICREDLPDELIYQITKTLMDNPKDVKNIHRAAKDIILEKFANNPQIPYHPGAIKYYKEKGGWTTEQEKIQNQFLSN